MLRPWLQSLATITKSFPSTPRRNSILNPMNFICNWSTFTLYTYYQTLCSKFSKSRNNFPTKFRPPPTTAHPPVW
jgi:hypothetical protein